jgi:hypothetical protein
MKAIDKNTKEKVLELLQAQRSQKEISTRTGVCIGTIQDWAAEWRKTGLLVSYKRPGMAFTNQAKSVSNGYYKSIRKRYLGMQWTDKLEKRIFGFNNPTEAIHYYLDSNGDPRVCAYCGIKPKNGKVWGLDRIDSSIGHIPGNLVPCCSTNEENRFLSCQTSKSNFNLNAWMTASMFRAYGKPLPEQVVLNRLEEVYSLAKELKDTVTV